jgi:sugar phosphate isomerase/epimerase
VYDSTIPAALRYAKAAGFRGIQLAVEAPHLAPGNLPADQVKGLAALLRSKGLGMSLHAPDRGVNLFQTQPVLAEAMHGYLRGLIDFGYAVGARNLTFHLDKPTTFPTADRSQDWPRIDRGLHERALQENMQRLIDAARGRMQLCLEFTGETFIGNACQEFINQGDLRICWDLARMYRRGELDEELADWFVRNLSRVAQVHLHDVVDGKGHHPIGSGCVEFARWLEPIVQADVRDLVIEVRPQDQAAASRETLLEMFNPARAPAAKKRRKRS